MSLLIENIGSGGSNATEIDTSLFTTRTISETISGAWNFTNKVNISVGSSSPALYVYNYGSGDIIHLDTAVGNNFTINHYGNVTLGHYGVNDSIGFLIAHNKNVGNGWWRGIEINDVLYDGGIEYAGYKIAPSIQIGTQNTNLSRYYGVQSHGYEYVNPLDHLQVIETKHFSADQQIGHVKMNTSNVYGFYSNIDYTLTPYLFANSTLSVTSTATNWTSITYGANKFVAVANNQSVDGNSYAAYSIDGAASWIMTSIPTSGAWSSVAYGNGIFLAISYNTTAVATSADGITWTAGTYNNLPLAMTADENWQLAFGNGIFVAVSTATGHRTTMTTTDGITWTVHTDVLPATSSHWTPVTFGNGSFYVANYHTAEIASSIDGASWVTASLAVTTESTSIAAGNDIVVCVGGSTIITSQVLVQRNGTWNVEGLPYVASWSLVTYDSGVFMAFGRIVEGTNVAVWSNDGITWNAFWIPEITTSTYTGIGHNGNFVILDSSLGAPLQSKYVSILVPSTTPSNYYNFYAASLAPNFFNGNTSFAHDVTINGTLTTTHNPVNNFDVVNKSYVDGAIAAAVLAGGTINYTPLDIAGGTMTGLLFLAGAPTSDLCAATKKYVDDAQSAKVNKLGDTMTGLLTLASDPSQALHAATKQYVDNNLLTKVNRAGDTLTGALTLASDPTQALHAATKQYVDNKAVPIAQRISWNNNVDVNQATFLNTFALVISHSITVPAGKALMSVVYRTNCLHNSSAGHSVEWRLMANGTQVAYCQSNPNGSDNMTFQLPMNFNLNVIGSSTVSLALQAKTYSTSGNVVTNAGQDASSAAWVPMGQSEIDILFF